jgi:hypothetical protein
MKFVSKEREPFEMIAIPSEQFVKRLGRSIQRSGTGIAGSAVRFDLYDRTITPPHVDEYEGRMQSIVSMPGQSL